MGDCQAPHHQDAHHPRHLLNDRVLPFFASQDMGLIRILTDCGTEYRGKLETHDYELYLGVNAIEHTRTKGRHPQTNGICERFHKTVLQEFYQVAFRRKLYPSLEGLQADLGCLAGSLQHRAHPPGQDVPRQNAHANPAWREKTLGGKGRTAELIGQGEPPRRSKLSDQV